MSSDKINNSLFSSVRLGLAWLALSPCNNGPAFLPEVAGVFSIINKGCDMSCESVYQDFSVGTRNISCCSSDLCNVNAAGSVRYSYGLAAGIAASVLWPFLNNRL